MSPARPRSAELFNTALGLFPGGVNSPVRAFRSVGGHPVYFARGEGAHVWDVDGHEYVDYVGAWGPLAIGHAHPDVVRAIERQARLGAGFGAPHELENELALRITASVPEMERVRLVTSGTEAVMSAIRLARAVTGREMVLKFEGGYHGHADSLLVRAGSGVATLGLPDSPGVPPALAALTAVAAYNDADSVQRALESAAGQFAAILVEPVAGNMGLVPPEPGFLSALRELSDEHGALLIFDEVMTGFRVSRGGACALFGVRPDLITLGKIIGGGLPIGAFGGPAETMDRVAPGGAVYQAGTMAGNPIACAAGIATLDVLLADGEWERAASYGQRLAEGLAAAAKNAGVAVRTAAVGTMVGLFFSATPVRNWTDASATDASAFRDWFHEMLDRGVNLPPSPYETMFISTVHAQRDLDRTLAAAEGALEALAFRDSPAVC